MNAGNSVCAINTTSGRYVLSATQNLGNSIFFCGEADFSCPGAWEGLPDAKIEVSDPKNLSQGLAGIISLAVQDEGGHGVEAVVGGCLLQRGSTKQTSQ